MRQFALAAGLGLALLNPIAETRAAPSNPLPRAAVDPGSEVAMHAMSMIGKPYTWGGGSPAEGFDCSGLVRFVFGQAVGVRLPRRAADMGRVGASVRQKHLRPGDLVFFDTRGSRNSHVGVYVGDGRFVHSPSAGKRIRLARLDNPYWTRRFNGARRPSMPAPTAEPRMVRATVAEPRRVPKGAARAGASIVHAVPASLADLYRY